MKYEVTDERVLTLEFFGQDAQLEAVAHEQGLLPAAQRPAQEQGPRLCGQPGGGPDLHPAQL